MTIVKAIAVKCHVLCSINNFCHCLKLLLYYKCNRVDAWCDCDFVMAETIITNCSDCRKCTLDLDNSTRSFDILIMPTAWFWEQFELIKLSNVRDFCFCFFFFSFLRSVGLSKHLLWCWLQSTNANIFVPLFNAIRSVSHVHKCNKIASKCTQEVIWRWHKNDFFF